MKYIPIKDCKSCFHKHLDIKYFNCHKDRLEGWHCNQTNELLVPIKDLEIIPLQDDFISENCPLEDLPTYQTKLYRVTHVIKEGNREHVVYYDSKGQHCSEKDCEVNKEQN